MAAAASPLRLLQRILLVLPVALFVGCSDASTPLAPRVRTTPLALLTPVVTVANTDDAGPGSLRQAIADAAAGTVIQFGAGIAGQTIVLSSGQLEIDKALTIEGPVPAGMTISGGLSSRVFFVQSTGDLVLRNVSVVNGRSSDGGGGLAIHGKVIIDHSLVANNEAIASSGGGIRVVESTAELVLVNSTVSGNHASIIGGGIEAGSTVSIRNSTIANNTAGDGGGIYVLEGNISLRNSIVANNIAGALGSYPNCFFGATATPAYAGRNVSSDGTCGTDASMIVGDPLLGALASNGGPTKTHALLRFSPATDAGTLCTESTDQRYVARDQGSSCDIGAFEFNDYGTFTLTIGPNIAVNAKTGVATLTGTIKCSAFTSLTLGVAMSQTQKTTGRFAEIVQANAQFFVAACGPSPSSWSAALTPQTGKFEPGSATGTATTFGYASDFLFATVTSALKVFQVK